MNRRRKWAQAGLTWLTISALAVAAWAAEPTAADRAVALALFHEGRKLMDAGEPDRACPKFAESLRVVPGAGTRFNLAQCQQQNGKLASAWANFNEVAALSQQAGLRKRAQAARQRAAALEPRLSKLRIAVPEPPNGLIVYRDDRRVEPAQWNAALPVDSGEHQVRAEAPGHVSKSFQVAVAGEATTVEVTVTLARDGPMPPATWLNDQPGLEPDEVSAAGQAASVRSTTGWVLVSLGAAQLLVGGIIYGIGDFNVTQAEMECPTSDSCDDAWAREVGNEGLMLIRLGAVSMAGGSGAIIAGGILLLSAMGDDETEEDGSTSYWVVPQVEAQAASLVVGVAW